MCETKVALILKNNSSFSPNQFIFGFNHKLTSILDNKFPVIEIWHFIPGYGNFKQCQIKMLQNQTKRWGGGDLGHNMCIYANVVCNNEAY